MASKLIGFYLLKEVNLRLFVSVAFYFSKGDCSLNLSDYARLMMTDNVLIKWVFIDNIRQGKTLVLVCAQQGAEWGYDEVTLDMGGRDLHLHNFLAADGSRMISGQSLVVNGGRL
ncbi:hypothetical protein [Marinomonas transparens]|uniref:Uncharacterized protein n=1 Tax=Marinomonas transparens TaxID=2795388 RepID=A0A934N7H1_9GAMM|nr:hypothetical protein [Marinomonas transparens]MBJ7539051.1 hypothetical protein [Marinomonas transparens]